MSDTPELVPFGDLDDDTEALAVIDRPNTSNVRFASVTRALELGLSRDVILKMFRIDPSLIPERPAP